MNHDTIILKNAVFCLLAGALIFTHTAAFAETGTGERKQKSVEINAEQLRQIEEMKEIKPVAEIREKEKGIPEIPKTVKREHLNPVEQAQLDELEHKRAHGKITETEYKLEKDSLFRDSNIKF